MATKKSNRTPSILILSTAVIIAIIAIFLINRPQEIQLAPSSSQPLTLIRPKENLASPLEVTNLKGVKGNEGSGVSTRMVYQNNFYHTIEASLVNPPKGSFYSGWLVKNQPELDLISTGKLEKIVDKYYLSYTQSKDISDHNQVIVTLEKDNDQIPEIQILTGNFK